MRLSFGLGLLLVVFACSSIQSQTQEEIVREIPTRSGSTSATNSKSGATISDITTNEDTYPNGKVPLYEKLEITFLIDSVAENPQMPYSITPPDGIKPEIGISVDALFTPDNWETIYQQPGFYYQEFQNEVKNGREWYYPTDEYSWKVRFTPNQAGDWQYKLVAQDAGGYSETPPLRFSVVASENRGFVRVSQADPRYFEFEDGTYFPALGYNMNYDHIDWVNPVLENEANFEIMSENGIQLVRFWLSQWAINGPSWNPWNSIDPKHHGQYIPWTELTFDPAFSSSEVSMKVVATLNPCMFIGAWKAPPAVKRNTTYRVRVRYKTTDIDGPRIAGKPFGFVAKTGSWLWGEGKYCHDPGTGTLVTPHQDQNTSDWQILEGKLDSGDLDFLPYFYLVMENANQGMANVDYVWIEEDLGDGGYGPNIVSKPWMAHHLYMEQRNSFAFDKLLELAEKYDIYLRPVIDEKNGWIFNRIDYEGNYIPNDPACRDQDKSNDPEKCPGNEWFYGNWRDLTKVRWLQQAWWRYLQARWGYATNIHSWELLNEGDPRNGLHYTLADEFGKYMHQFTPNHHMVSTSFWHSFPKDDFLANPEYHYVDFADVHQYIGQDDPNFLDASQATYQVSTQYGAKEPGGAGKPVIRGETGFVLSRSGQATDQLLNDSDGIWLHNFIWGGINAGGLIESYWYENTHIYNQNRDGSYNFDHRPQYGAYFNFIKDIPLNNGNYQDAEAVGSSDDLRVWGQKDLGSGNAHLWIQNKNHTWHNSISGNSIPSVSGTINLTGFQPGESYTLEWWDPYESDITKQVIGTETTLAESDGSISIKVDDLAEDVAVKIRLVKP